MHASAVLKVWACAADEPANDIEAVEEPKEAPVKALLAEEPILEAPEEKVLHQPSVLLFTLQTSHELGDLTNITYQISKKYY